MADTDDVAPNSDLTFKPPPPKAPELYQVVLLFIYHILLAVFLAYAIYQVWPPQPWPGDEEKQAGNVNANSTAANANAGGGNMNARARAGAGGQNNNTASGNASNAAATGNTNTSAATNINSATNTNTATGSGTAASGGNANGTETSNANNNASGATAVDDTSGTERKKEWPRPFYLFGWKFQPTLEVRLILLVMLVGAIGSYVHSTSSIVDYLGNRTFISSWVWWYLLRPFIGMMLALIFYFVFRGGFITAGVNSAGDNAASFINPFGIAALAGLVGMFSKVASDKLNEVFTTLFRPAPGQGDAKRGDKLGIHPVPAITSITPAAVKVGTKNVSVAIEGSNYTEKSAVKFNGETRVSKFVDASSLSVQLLDTDTATAGTFEITVVNPTPGGGTSKAAQFKVEP